MLGDHLIKTWSATQQAYALSSAEAELYAMVEGVTRAKALGNLARELGFRDLSQVVKLGTDSSAAKSFVCRKGLGRMRHLEIRDLWLQKEVADGRVIVEKIPGEQNPADLMTKVLGVRDIAERLSGINLRMTGRDRRGIRTSDGEDVNRLRMDGIRRFGWSRRREPRTEGRTDGDRLRDTHGSGWDSVTDRILNADWTRREKSEIKWADLCQVIMCPRIPRSAAIGAGGNPVSQIGSDAEAKSPRPDVGIASAAEVENDDDKGVDGE